MPKILNRFLIAAILTLLLSEISVVSAQYKPPSDQRPPRERTISGCCR